MDSKIPFLLILNCFTRCWRAELVPDGTLSSAEATIILEAFIVADTLDDRYDMPLLMKAGKVLLIKPEVLPRSLACDYRPQCSPAEPSIQV